MRAPELAVSRNPSRQHGHHGRQTLFQRHTPREHRRHADGPESFVVWKRSFKRHVWRACDRRCVYCGVELELAHLTIDHVVPVSRGGQTNLGNCVGACEGCNKAKGCRSLADFIASVPDAGQHFMRLARLVTRSQKRLARRALSLALAQSAA